MWRFVASLERMIGVILTHTLSAQQCVAQGGHRVSLWLCYKLHCGPVCFWPLTWFVCRPPAAQVPSQLNASCQTDGDTLCIHSANQLVFKLTQFEPPCRAIGLISSSICWSCSCLFFDIMSQKQFISTCIFNYLTAFIITAVKLIELFCAWAESYCLLFGWIFSLKKQIFF